MSPGDEAIVTGNPTRGSMRITSDLEHGELVQILQINEALHSALVWGAASGAKQWICLESLTPPGKLTQGFLEGWFDE